MSIWVWACCMNDNGGDHVESLVASNSALPPGKSRDQPSVVEKMVERVQDGAVKVIDEVRDAVQDIKEAVGASGQYDVLITKSDTERSVGVSLDRTDQTILQVLKVNDGLIDAYNAKAPEDKRITPECFILEVSDCKDDAVAMIETMKRMDSFNLKVAPKEEFYATFSKHGTPLGLDLVYQPESKCLVIKNVKEGTVSAYNDATSDTSKKIVAGDRIMEVNGVAGPSETLLEALGIAEEVKVKVMRPQK